MNVRGTSRGLERINTHQLFCTLTLFEIGSTALYALGISARQDAWIVDILAMLNGFVVLCFFVHLQLRFPAKNLIEIIEALVGRALGVPLALLYVMYFVMCSVRNFSEFNFLISMTYLQKTSKLIISIVFMALICYYLFLGLETISRTSEIVLPVLIFFLFIIYLLTPLSGVVQLKYLEPVLSGGWPLILRNVYPSGIIFPYGESALFFMFWKHTTAIRDIRKVGLLSFLITGIIVTLSVVLIVSVLGPVYAENASIPLLEVIKTINVLDILSNLSGFGVVILFIGGFYKALLNALGALIAFSAVVPVKRNYIVLPLCLLILWIATADIPSFSYHQAIVIGFYLMHLIFQIVLPALLYLIYLIKRHVLKIDFGNGAEACAGTLPRG